MAVDGATIATLIVAGGTILLAWATFRLGTRAAEDTRAQWRPVLLVRAKRHPADEKIHRAGDEFVVEVENVGRGPAIDVTSRSHFHLLANERVSAMAPGETAEFRVEYSPEEPVGMSLAYSDLAKAGYGTTVILSMHADKPHLVYQSFETHPPVTFWWTALVPRPLRPKLWPIVRWRLRRRGYTIP